MVLCSRTREKPILFILVLRHNSITDCQEWPANHIVHHSNLCVMQTQLFDYPRLKDFPKKNPDAFLVRACDKIERSALKRQLTVWCQMALSVETPAYHTQEERLLIEEFCSLFHPLLDAMYCIGISLKCDQQGQEFTDAISDYLKNYYDREASTEEIIGPFSFPKFFFEHFNIQCTRSLLWIMLEAVIIYDGELTKMVERREVLQYYERFLVIAESANAIKTKFKDRIGICGGKSQAKRK